MRNCNIIFSLIFSCIAVQAVSQPIACRLYLNQFNPNRDVPVNIQSTRSAVLIWDENNEVEQLAEEAHGYFRKMNIDAILYFNIYDLYAGTDATAAFINQLNTRKVENLIFMIKRPNGQLEIIITPFKENLTPPTNSTSTWGITTSVLEDGLKVLANDLIRAELLNNNFLIPEKANFVNDVVINKNLIFNVHTRDLKVLKLAVRRFEKLPAIGTAEVNAYNQRIDAWNNELEILMQSYPFEVEYVETLDEKELYRQGFQYALFFVRTSGHNIRKFFNMEMDPGETEYVSLNSRSKQDVSLERIPIGDVVYKFYMKQVITGDVYLGDKWDTAYSWQQALENHINNFRTFMKL